MMFHYGKVILPAQVTEKGPSVIIAIKKDFYRLAYVYNKETQKGITQLFLGKKIMIQAWFEGTEALTKFEKLRTVIF